MSIAKGRLLPMYTTATHLKDGITRPSLRVASSPPQNSYAAGCLSSILLANSYDSRDW